MDARPCKAPSTAILVGSASFGPVLEVTIPELMQVLGIPRPSAAWAAIKNDEKGPASCRTTGSEPGESDGGFDVSTPDKGGSSR